MKNPCLSYRHEYGRRRCASDNFSGTGLICGGGTDLSEHEWRKLCKSSSFTESSGMDHICLYGSPAQQTCVYSQCMQQAVAGRKNRCKIYIVYTGRTCKIMESEQQKDLPHRSLMQRIIIAGSLHYTTRMEF